MTSYLNSTVAKDGGEDWRREHGEDGQQDRNAGCDDKTNDHCHCCLIMACAWRDSSFINEFHVRITANCC